MSFHFLPSDHQAGLLLDSLFGRSCVIDDEATFCAAGFVIRAKMPRSLMRVATHPAVNGYVFKVFLVDERQREREKSRGWKGFAVRCARAQRIRTIIRNHEFRHFKAPRKWLFHPPRHPACDLSDQPVILIAEFQDLLSREENAHAWRHCVTEDHLDELYAIIEGAGGISYRPDNIMLTRQGRFAFIDTEHFGEERDYESITPHLSTDMRRYWLKLTNANKP